MIDRKLDGPAPRTAMPKGATDTQMHMYLPGFEMRPDGVGAPADPLPDPAMYRRVMGWLGLDRVVITQGNAHGDDNASLLACVAETILFDSNSDSPASQKVVDAYLAAHLVQHRKPDTLAPSSVTPGLTLF